MSTNQLRDQLQSSLGNAFTLTRELEPGGMARIFIAHERRLGRDVAVKVLSPALAGGLNVERFAREIRVAAQLQEPHIVPLLAAGETGDGLPYYTMPYVAGRSLRDCLADGAIARDEALKILTDIARALAHAHEHGVVHRDIKPANVLLSSGTAVVTDFGIAKALTASRIRMEENESGEMAAADQSLTSAPTNDVTMLRTTGLTTAGTGATLGTPAYMAPEQAIGDVVGASADVYAWGVMAYELLAGVHPFAECRTPQQMLAAHLSAVPVSLSQKVRDLPRELATLVACCMEKAPDRRPQSGGELLDALRRAATAPPVTRRQRAAILVTTTVGGLGLLLGAESFVRARSAEAAGPPLVAVLPVETAGAAGDSTFPGALGDAVTGRLARLPSLRVIDRQSVIAARRATAGPQQVGRALGADYVLRTSIRSLPANEQTGDVLVRATLIRVKDGTTKWSGDEQRARLDDPVAAAVSLATNVVDALDVSVAKTERARIAEPPVIDSAARAAYTRGRALSRQANATRSIPSMSEALRQFELAYRLDSTYADAFAAASGVLSQLIGIGAEQVGIDSVDALAARALAIDPSQTDAIFRRSLVRAAKNDVSGARDVLETGLRAYPSNPQLLGRLGWNQLATGDVSAAWRSAQEIARIAPRNASALSSAAEIAWGLRRYDQAERWYRTAIEEEPQRVESWMRLAGVAGDRGDTAGVDAAIREYRSHGGQVGVVGLPTFWLGGTKLRAEIASMTADMLGVSSAQDSIEYYVTRAYVHEAAAEQTKQKAAADSGLAIVRRLLATRGQDPNVARSMDLKLAGFLAVQGDQQGALEALQRFRNPPELAKYPDGVVGAYVACFSYVIYAKLALVDRLIPELQRCVSLPGGRSRAAIRASPVMTRYLEDPRVRAVLQ